MPHAKTALQAGMFLALAFAGFLLARFGAPIAGLTPAAQSVLGAAFAGTVLWVSEAIPPGLTGLVVLSLLGLCPGIHFPEMVSGFAGEVTFFLIGAVAIGSAVETSGLAARSATFLCRTARGNPARLYAQLIGGIPLLAFLVPSAITRNAILVPAYRDALSSMGVDQTRRSGRAIMLALGVLNPLASSALLTGGITSITAASLIGGFSWVTWFTLMAVPYYALLCLGAILLRLLVGPFERAAVSVPPASAAQPFSVAESRTLAVLVLTSLLWLTDSVHHLSPAIPALLGGVLLLLPGPGVLPWKAFETRLSWGLILTVGASLSLATLMTSTGAAAWIGNVLLAPLSELGGTPRLLVIGLILAVAAVHLAITNLAACVALLLPISSTVAAGAALNPVVVGLVLTLSVDAVILYPVQTASNLMAYESGYFDRVDVARLGSGMLALTVLVVMLILPYWALLGLPLSNR